MGGGVGISVHGSHRVAGDKFMFAMPEFSIGFFPDVGATFFLPRLPAAFGIYCALTGERLDAADAVAAVVATHRVPWAQFPDVIETWCRAVRLDASLAACARRAAQGPVVSRRTAIETLFTGEQVEDILAALDAAGAAGGADAAFASAAVALIRTKSPTSLKIALAQMRRGSALDFAECMRTEFRIVSRVVRGRDFYEGIRAVIIDKDGPPRWQPSTLAAVSAAEVERHFAPLASELELPCPTPKGPRSSSRFTPRTAKPTASNGPTGWWCSFGGWPSFRFARASIIGRSFVESGRRFPPGSFPIRRHIKWRRCSSRSSIWWRGGGCGWGRRGGRGGGVPPGARRVRGGFFFRQITGGTSGAVGWRGVLSGFCLGAFWLARRRRRGGT